MEELKAENKYRNVKVADPDQKWINVLSLCETNTTQCPDTMLHCHFLFEILPSNSEATNLFHVPKGKSKLCKF